jgi:hypothetical protein
MKTKLGQDEAVVKEGRANISRGMAVGGKMYLTNKRLIFEAVKGNKPVILGIRLSSIESLDKPRMPNSLAVRTTEGKEYRFVLPGRDVWISAINGQEVSGEEAVYPAVDENVGDQIKWYARNALSAAVIGIVAFGIILEPVAFYRAHKAIRMVQEYEEGHEHLSKAKAAQIIAVVGFLAWLLLIVVYFAQR